MNATMTTYDIRTGRPLHEGDEAVETLADDELEAELTIALLNVELRRERYERLSDELLSRRREPVPTTDS
jgi:hypothetical protein